MQLDVKSKRKINPAYLKASHLVIMLHRNAPSINEQIQADMKAQTDLKRELKRQEKC